MQQVITQILTHYRQRLATNNNKDFLKLYGEFVDKLAFVDDHALEVLEENVLAAYSAFFTYCQRRYLRIKENEVANSMLNISNIKNYLIRDLLPYGYGKNSYHRVQDLSIMVNFSSCRRIVMVGCGALPSTLFWLYDHCHEVELVGIDIDSDCIYLAAEVVKALGLKGILLKKGDGRELDYSSFDFVYIANQVTPKKDVLEHIANTVTKNTQIVVRNPTRLGKLFAECVGDTLPHGFSMVRSGSESKEFFSVDLLVRLNRSSKL